ncbi:hypothetical protein KJ925_04225, partial [Patescibacteria group bacterium]|nr:hypothetical protein [Patescibacteria group bacterium]
MDFTGFIVVLLGLLTNPLGIVDGMEDVLATARDLADEGQLRARQLLGRHLARPMRTLVFICGAVLLAAVLLVSYLHFAVLGWTGWSTLGLVAYAAVTVAGIIIALLVAQRQVAIIEDPGDDPINARNRLTGYVLIAAIAVSSIALSLLALGTESRSLWLVS